MAAASSGNAASCWRHGDMGSKRSGKPATIGKNCWPSIGLENHSRNRLTKTTRGVNTPQYENRTSNPASHTVCRTADLQPTFQNGCGFLRPIAELYVRGIFANPAEPLAHTSGSGKPDFR